MTNEDLNIIEFIKEENEEIKTYLSKKFHFYKGYRYYPKCSKCLRKKYKKYKINRNEIEDSAVLELANIFDNSLDFKGLFKSDIQDLNELRQPRNYLAKMAKCKSKAVNSPKHKINNDSNQKRKTDAFKLLMNSRNRSIGTNSPGKEDVIKVEDSEEITEKKANKVKRNLTLQKMAEAKGALKRIEAEEHQEKCIKQKMAKRAKRLKQMITKCNKKDLGQDNTINGNSISKDEEELKSIIPAITDDNNIKGILSASSQLDLDLEPDIEKDVKPIYKKQKRVNKEDEEFLSKLSPSIRKKENMLCYFKKLNNTTEKILGDPEDSESAIIKVKMIKNKNKKTRLSLTKCNKEVLKNKKDLTNLMVNGHKNFALVDNTDIPIIDFSEDLDKPRKRKRKLKDNHVKHEEDLDKSLSIDRRSQRTKKKPVRYDDSLTISSDEDIPIFHLKKAKHSQNKDVKSIKKVNETNKITKEKIPVSKHLRKPTKQNAKLAPIFVSKAPLNLEALEAKQKFLQSGVPEKLKKIIIQKQISETTTTNFQKVVHVKQYTNEAENIMKCQDYHFIMKPEDEMKDITNYKCGDFLSLDIAQINTKIIGDPLAKSIKQVLKNIKESYPDFPVFRTYKTLKSKSTNNQTNSFLNMDNSLELNLDECEIQDTRMQCWTDKYRAASTQEIFGNFENIKELRKWLVSWKESMLFTKNSHNTKDSDLSDFYQSDSDSKDSIANCNNLLMITGPTGCGKTSSIYAVANELSIKVLEVNASSRRTGKILLQDLQEATLSHKVNRGKGSSAENSQNSQNIGENNSQTQKNKRRNKQSQYILPQSRKLLSQTSETSCLTNQESGHTDVSLILIDDADIVFDQDDGFVSGVAQLIHISKRPVILVTSTLTCQSLQRFSNCSNIIKLHPLSPRILGTWLDILCIADSGQCWPGMGARILSQNRGDIRKSINYLQFVTCSEKILKCNSLDDAEDKDSQEDITISDLPDENSNMSWSGKKHLDSKYIDKNQDVEVTAYEPSTWNIYDDWRKNCSGIIQNSSNISKLGNLFDSYSMVDCINRSRSNDCMNPFYSSEMNSVSEEETYEDYDGCNDLASEISRYLIDRSKAHMGATSSSKPITHADDPRDREKTVSRHKVLSSSLISATVMDRRAISLDYWSLCRSICRIEKEKTDNNSKRNNRFYHYLKTSKVKCKTDVFSKLCRSLQVKDYDVNTS